MFPGVGSTDAGNGTGTGSNHGASDSGADPNADLGEDTNGGSRGTIAVVAIVIIIVIAAVGLVLRKHKNGAATRGGEAIPVIAMNSSYTNPLFAPNQASSASFSRERGSVHISQGANNTMFDVPIEVSDGASTFDEVDDGYLKVLDTEDPRSSLPQYIMQLDAFAEDEASAPGHGTGNHQEYLEVGNTKAVFVVPMVKNLETREIIVSGAGNTKFAVPMADETC